MILISSKKFDVYSKEVRSLLEMAVPVWHGGLTKQESGKIERVQKIAFKIILGEHFQSYDVACTLFGVEPLELRRTELCLNFAKKDIKKDTSVFSKNHEESRTRRKPDLVKEFKCRTKRFEKSSLPYLSRLLNSS